MAQSSNENALLGPRRQRTQKHSRACALVGYRKHVETPDGVEKKWRARVRWSPERPAPGARRSDARLAAGGKLRRRAQRRRGAPLAPVEKPPRGKSHRRAFGSSARSRE